MKELFAPYHIAELAKEKGFNSECLAYYQNKDLILTPMSKYSLEKHKLGILAPLYQQLIDWFREKHNIHVYELPTFTKQGFCFKVNDFNKEQTEPGQYIKTVFGDSYYEALNKALEEAFKLI